MTWDSDQGWNSAASLKHTKILTYIQNSVIIRMIRGVFCALYFELLVFTFQCSLKEICQVYFCLHNYILLFFQVVKTMPYFFILTVIFSVYKCYLYINNKMKKILECRNISLDNQMKNSRTIQHFLDKIEKHILCHKMTT